MTTLGVLAIYCVLILLASLAGGFVPLFVKLTHRRMQLAISFVAGLMLGIAVLHMLPHALMTIPAMSAARWLILGLLVMFFLERFFCFHHHDAPQQNPPVEGHADDGDSSSHNHSHACSHTHDDGHGQSHEHRLGWYGAAVGLTVHSVINGVALAATMNSQTLSDAHGGGLEGWLPGLAVFLVILLHKPFDSLTLGTLMAAGGRSVVSRHLVNGLFALAVPVGAVLFQLGLATISIQHSTFIGATVAFSAGVFLVISLSDLLPELQFHHHDRGTLSTALLLGVALAWAISHFEAKTHQHDDHVDTPAAPAQHDDHAGHGH